MKKISTLILISLFAGLSSCNQQDTPANIETAEKEAIALSSENEKPEKPEKLMVVAMVNTDTLMQNYLLAQEFRQKLEDKTSRYEKILKSDETKLMSDAQKLQASAASMTQFEAQVKERDLYKRQEELQIKQEKYTRELMAMEQDYNKQIDVAINKFLEGYCADKPYEMVLSTSGVGIIRWAHKSLDITSDVLVGLNAEYQNNTSNNADLKKK